jgi:DNA helicase HerA-like ATPase
VFANEEKYIGTLVGETGSLQINIALRDSFSARRGEFVRVGYLEECEGEQTWVLGRILGVSRQNILFTPTMGEGVADVRLLANRHTGESNYALMELIGYRDPTTGEIKIPRRPLEPGARVYPVNFEFLKIFYEYSPETNIRLGNLVGYEKGENIVPVFIDINKIVTEHLAVLAMTGAGKSYTVGRIIERMLVEINASIVVFDPHGEYGRAFRGGQINYAPNNVLAQQQENDELLKICRKLEEMQSQGGGIQVYTPRSREFSLKYAGQNIQLALRLDEMHVEELGTIFPEMTEPQQRILQVVLKYWEKNNEAPRDPTDLIELCTTKLDQLRNWGELSEGERKSISSRSTSIVALRLRNLLEDARSFYEPGLKPFDVREMIGIRNNFTEKPTIGRIAIIDLQGLSKTSMEVVVAIICNEILKAAQDSENPIRPVFVVIEEGHIFAPAQEASLSRSVIKKIAAEGRKFGVGLSIISQRPNKLDADVTSQCNTIIAMRIKNPDDQRFIAKTSDYFSEADLRELPSLSTGEALVTGRAILAPLIVKVGPKALIHGGEAPDVVRAWRT